MAREQQQADWHIDPDNGELMRYWDGQQWTEQRQSRALYLAHVQAEAARHTAHNTDTIKQIMLFVLILGFLAAVFAAIAIFGKTS